MDRFLMKVLITYPDPDSERQVLGLVRSEDAGAANGQAAAPPPKIPQKVVFAARREINGIKVSDAIARYIVDIVNATRRPDRYGEVLAKWIQVGSSLRGGIRLDRASRTNAWLQGHDYVTPDDVRGVLRHRLILSYDANADGVLPDQVVDKLVEVVAVPA